METRYLGRTGLRVSVLAFGAMTFGGQGQFFEGIGSVPPGDARRMVDMCLDAGVNLFDTADVYSSGISETMLGKAIGDKRDQCVIATKLHGRMGSGPNDLGASRHHIMRACEASLRRLGTDYIDLYQLHGFDGMTSAEETLSALTDLVRQGKVRYIGCSNFSGWQLMKALAVSDHRNLERFAAHQVYYSLVARELEFELVPLAVDQDLGILVWSPLAGGFLSGKYPPGGPAPDDSRGARMDLDGIADVSRGHQIVEALAKIADSHGASASQAAINWLLGKPYVTSVIVGARGTEQLRDTLATVSWQMSDHEMSQLDALSAPRLPYPYWHQRKYNEERVPLVPSAVTPDAS
jgi:aryl-alcohol dehydrogenase-like predicted oxidoreductase